MYCACELWQQILHRVSVGRRDHCKGLMPASLAVCTGMGVERFDFKELACLAVLKEATIRCAIMFHDMPAHQHTPTTLRATLVGTATRVSADVVHCYRVGHNGDLSPLAGLSTLRRYCKLTAIMHASRLESGSR